jgi:hypothetical protein
VSKVQPRAMRIAVAWAAAGLAVSIALRWPLHSVWDALAVLALPMIAGRSAYLIARNNHADAA